VLLEQIARTRAAVAEASARKQKVARLAEALAAAPAGERALAARYLAGEVGRKLGLGYAAVSELRGQVAPAAAATLSLTKVDQRFLALAAAQGAGSVRARREGLGALLAAATAIEQSFLAALVIGELRQGALDALVAEAIAQAIAAPPAEVRTALMLAGDLGALAEAALAGGRPALAAFGLALFRPVLPMLAQPADTVGAALADLAEGSAGVALEHKLDGFRLQLHKEGDEVRAYSRAQNDVTAMVPELCAGIRALPARRLVVDGEALALGPTGRPLPFQDTMRRKSEAAAGDGLSLALFDALLVGDRTLLGAPARERFAELGAAAPGLAVPQLVTADPAAAEAFYAAAIAAGHEGVMVKSLAAPYEAGSRGAAWRKVKQVRRLDLVVLGAEWGSGRRRGLLSSLHLGARMPGAAAGTDDWAMLGKTFKGMTDEVLAWQTAELLARAVERDDRGVRVRPELVVEIAFNEVQRSSHYRGGFALRHARLVRYRPDKVAADADSLAAVRAFAVADGVG
jgi:DNA ligase-1